MRNLPRVRSSSKAQGKQASMSGRAYARNPSGALGGATDINSIVPHRFRIEAPRCTNKLKDAAIRRAIQRRCKEKNWKKLLRLRHTRLVPVVDELLPEENSLKEDDRALENGHTSSEENGADVINNASEQTTAEQASGVEKEEEGEKMEIETPVVVDPKEKEREELELAKQKLREMEERLTTLSAEKHAKFQQLKDILIAEARSKSMPPMPKKRRVDSVGSVGTSNSPSLTAVSGGTIEGGISLLGAPGPNLLRAQSFSGTSSICANDFASSDAQSKDPSRR